MNYDKIYTELTDEIEYEYTQRIEELRKFERCIELSTDNNDVKNDYRKMLIVMAYAYFEGFCKKALLIYIDKINRRGLKTNEVKYGLAAISLQHEFDLLSNPNHKPIPIKGELIDKDARLHRYSRQKEFMEKYSFCMNKTVVIDEAVVDTESNLKSYVLKSLLYKLDLDYTVVDKYQNELNLLIGKRNAIVHGEVVRGISKEEYDDYIHTTEQLMQSIKAIIISAFKEEQYKSAYSKGSPNGLPCVAVDSNKR